MLEDYISGGILGLFFSAAFWYLLHKITVNRREINRLNDAIDDMNEKLRPKIDLIGFHTEGGDVDEDDE